MRSCKPIKLNVAARLVGCAQATICSWAAYQKIHPILSDDGELLGYDPAQILEFVTAIYATPHANKAKTFHPDVAKSYLIEEGYIQDEPAENHLCRELAKFPKDDECGCECENRVLLRTGSRPTNWKLMCGAGMGYNDLMLERWNDKTEVFDRLRVDIKYCPFCGEKLEDTV